MKHCSCDVRQQSVIRSLKVNLRYISGFVDSIAVHLPKSTEPVIKLMKPCVRELDICNIFCAYGYLRGPDNCQFCACSH